MNDKKVNPVKETDWVSVNTASEVIVMMVSDIVRLEANRNYTNIVLENDKQILISKSLKEFENLLSPYNFLRIHKSHLINPTHISHFVKKGAGYIYLKNSFKLQVSLTGKEKFLKFLRTNTINL